MTTFDLSEKHAEHLDSHLLLALLEFLADKKIHDEREILESTFTILQSTRLHKQAQLVAQKLQKKLPAYLEVAADLEPLAKRTESTLKAIRAHEIKVKEKSDLPRPALEIQTAELDVLLEYAKLVYETGDYNLASEIMYLANFVITDASQKLTALWGKLSASICAKQFGFAFDDILNIHHNLEGNNTLSPVQLLQQRIWLMSWSLFVLFSQHKGRDKDALLDIFFQPSYVSALQALAPYLLRYLTAAVLLGKRTKSFMRDLTRLIKLETYQYQDPVTKFIYSLFVECSFTNAQSSLAEFSRVCAEDFWLAPLSQDIIDSARLVFVDAYSRIHSRFEIVKVAAFLGLDTGAAEALVAELVKNGAVDASIDAQSKVVTTGQLNRAVFQDLTQRTKQVLLQSQAMIFALEKK